MSDNGPEFRGTLERERPFETMCQELGIKHLYTKPYRPQTNGKIEAFFKILKGEFFYPNSFDSQHDLIMNLGNFLFEYNHLRRHGGLNYETPFDKLQKVTELLSYYNRLLFPEMFLSTSSPIISRKRIPTAHPEISI
jgi:transposase InsO family protein